MSPNEILEEIEKKKDVFIPDLNSDANVFYFNLIKSDIIRDIDRLNKIKFNLERLSDLLCFPTDLKYGGVGVSITPYVPPYSIRKVCYYNNDALCVFIENMYDVEDKIEIIFGEELFMIAKNDYCFNSTNGIIECHKILAKYLEEKYKWKIVYNGRYRPYIPRRGYEKDN